MNAHDANVGDTVYYQFEGREYRCKITKKSGVKQTFDVIIYYNDADSMMLFSIEKTISARLCYPTPQKDQSLATFEPPNIPFAHDKRKDKPKPKGLSLGAYVYKSKRKYRPY